MAHAGAPCCTETRGLCYEDDREMVVKLSMVGTVESGGHACTLFHNEDDAIYLDGSGNVRYEFQLHNSGGAGCPDGDGVPCSRLRNVGTANGAAGEAYDPHMRTYAGFTLCLLYTSPSPRDRG